VTNRVIAFAMAVEPLAVIDGLPAQFTAASVA
jgi:hypothetical protein